MQDETDKLYIVMPAYNEEDNIEEVVKEWHEVVVKTGTDSRLMVINDGSKDGTFAKLMELKEKYPQLVPLNKQNGGHGPAVMFAYHHAIAAGAKYVFQTDSDGQTLPSEFWQFWNERENYDIQFGFRKKREDGFGRWVVTRTLRLIVWSIFHTWVTDANAPYRLMSAKTLDRLITLIPDNYNLPNIVLSVLYIKNKYKFRFKRITFRPRQGGVNSINLKSISKIGWKALSDFVSLGKKVNANPLPPENN